MPNADDLLDAIQDTRPRCPQCGEPYNEVDDDVIVCSECGSEGCTKCCIPGGRGTACVECEGNDA